VAEQKKEAVEFVNGLIEKFDQEGMVTDESDRLPALQIAIAVIDDYALALPSVLVLYNIAAITQPHTPTAHANPNHHRILAIFLSTSISFTSLLYVSFQF
jgi:hypothetical protein